MGFDTDSDLSQGIVEELTPTTSVFIWGWGGATAPDFPVVVPFNGEISYCPVGVTGAGGITRCPAPVSCASAEHVLTLSGM